MPFDIDHEIETSNILKNKEYANKMDELFGLNKFQVEAMRLLGTDDEYQMSEKQKLLVEKFIHNSLGDMDLNTKLKSIAVMGLQNTGLYSNIIGSLMYLTFKTRRLDEFMLICEKVNKNQNRINNGMQLDENHKISLKEYSIFTDMAKLNNMFNGLNKKVQYDEKSHLGILHQNINKAAGIKSQMEESYSSNAKFSPGMLVFDHIAKRASVFGKVLNFFDNLVQKFIIIYGHASKLYENSESESKLSHINPGPKDDEFALRDYLYSDIYQIKIDHLISDMNKNNLEKVFGKNWLKIINEEYAKIERQIHDDTFEKFSGLQARSEKFQYKVGAATLLPFGLGHKKIKPTDFAKTHKRMIGQHYEHNSGKMLCSEFVATTTIAALYELNLKLVAYCKSEGLELGNTIIKMPISKYENLHRMHPDRFLHVLNEAGCLEKVAQLPQVKQYFKKF